MGFFFTFAVSLMHIWKKILRNICVDCFHCSVQLNVSFIKYLEGNLCKITVKIILLNKYLRYIKILQLKMFKFYVMHKFKILGNLKRKNYNIKLRPNIKILELFRKCIRNVSMTFLKLLYDI